MTDKLEYNGYVSGGQMFIRNRKDFEKEVKRFEGKDVEIVVQKKRSRRSQMQTRDYWGVCVSMVRDRFIELGNDCTKDDVHCFLKSQYLFTETLIDDEVIRIPKGTSALSKSDFSEFISKIQKFASETLDIYIPDANEQIVFDL